MGFYDHPADPEQIGVHSVRVDSNVGTRTMLRVTSLVDETLDLTQDVMDRLIP